MITIRWGFCPPEVRAAVRPLVVQYLWLAPAWLRWLYVAYDHEHPDGPEANASAGAEPEYLQGRLFVHASWLAECARARRLAIIHEMLHLPVMPMAQEHTDTIKRLFEDGDAPKFKSKLDECWRRSVETSVQTLTHSILMLDPSTLPVVPFLEEEDESGR